MKEQLVSTPHSSVDRQSLYYPVCKSVSVNMNLRLKTQKRVLGRIARASGELVSGLL